MSQRKTLKQELDENLSHRGEKEQTETLKGFKNHPRLSASLKRGDAYKLELTGCDDAMRNQLLACWKEQIIEDCLHVLRAIDNPDSIACIDSAIAIAGDVNLI